MKRVLRRASSRGQLFLWLPAVLHSCFKRKPDVLGGGTLNLQPHSLAQPLALTANGVSCRYGWGDMTRHVQVRLQDAGGPVPGRKLPGAADVPVATRVQVPNGRHCKLVLLGVARRLGHERAGNNGEV